MAHTPDSARLVYSVWGADRTLNLEHRGGPVASLELAERLSGRQPFANWVAPEFVLAREGRFTRSWRVPDASTLTASILVRADRAAELIVGVEALVEVLAASVEHAQWALIHRLADAQLDEVRSDFVPLPMPHPWQKYFTIERAVLQDDPRLYSAFFTIQAATMFLYCGGAFRERVQRMGLVGLSFKKVGYFHRNGDPEPPPLRPMGPTTSGLVQPRSPIWQASELARNARTVLDDASAQTRGRLELGDDATPECVLESLTQEVVALQRSYPKLQPADRQQLLLGLSALLGSLYVSHLQWQWCELSAPDGQRLLATTTPDRSHFVAVSAILDTLIMNKQRDVTLSLAFNMARNRLLPPSAPGALIQLT